MLYKYEIVSLTRRSKPLYALQRKFFGLFFPKYLYLAGSRLSWYSQGDSTFSDCLSSNLNEVQEALHNLKPTPITKLENTLTSIPKP